MALRLVFLGTPDFAVPVLEAMIGAGHDIVAVYCQPPRPAGRGMSEQKSPVQRAAESHGLPVRTPKTFKDDAARAAFAGLGADAAVVVAYGLLLPKAVLDAPRLGCFNLHASALPRWRGAAPIQRAIMAGDAETAVMVMRMEEELDTGPVCLAERVAISTETTAGELHDRLAGLGARLMVAALDKLERGQLACQPQPRDGVTYARKIDKAETRLDFSRPARDVVNWVRGLSPYPGAWFEARSPGAAPERIRVLRAELFSGAGAPGAVLDDQMTIACGEGAVRLIEVQRAGKKPMSAAEFRRGFVLAKGDKVA